jgi:hypothetical protein
MAQLIFGEETGDQVLSNLPDGAYPGFDVVESQNPVAGWNSRPKPPFSSVHIPGAPTSDFTDLMEADIDPNTGIPRSNEKRRLIVDFLPAQANEKAQERTLVVVNSNALRRGLNPNAGGGNS